MQFKECFYSIFEMKKLRYNIVVICMFLTVNIFAESVTVQQARIVAGVVSRQLFAVRTRSVEPALTLVYAPSMYNVRTRATGDQAAFYVYNIGDNAGFVIVAGDDNVMPILAYSDSGSFPMEDIPQNMAKQLELYARQVAYASENDVATPAVEEAWTVLYATGDSPINPTPIVRLESASWNQTFPYNFYCPSSAVTGCVATTMGIVMKYFNYPEQGSGSNAYTTTTNKYEIAESFETAYDWDNMLVSYAGDYTDEQRNAVARLLYHCGVATCMDYTPTGSGTTVQHMVDALRANFSYDTGVYIVHKYLYSEAEWHTILQSELDAARLIPYSGTSETNSGHIFILDGYAENDYYHVNWGWGGNGNGYYLLSALGVSEKYTLNQDAVLGVQPAIEGSYPRYEIYFPATDDGTDFGLSMTTTPWGYWVDATTIRDYGLMPFEGKYALYLVDKHNNLKESLYSWDITLEQNYVWSLSRAVLVNPKTTIEPGDKIEMYYSTDYIPWTKITAEPDGIDALVLIEDDSAETDTPETPDESGIVETQKTLSEKILVQSQGENLSIVSPSPIWQIELYALNGAAFVVQKQAGEYTLQCPFGVSAGTYILRVTTADGVVSRKIIKL